LALCYIHPLKHGLVQSVADWPHSGFHRDVRKGIYPENWAGRIVEMEAGEA
jgi:putative transposase